MQWHSDAVFCLPSACAWLGLNISSNAQLDLKCNAWILKLLDSQPRTFAWISKRQKDSKPRERWQPLQHLSVSLHPSQRRSDRSISPAVTGRVILALAHWRNPPEESGLIVCQRACSGAVTATDFDRLLHYGKNVGKSMYVNMRRVL